MPVVKVEVDAFTNYDDLPQLLNVVEVARVLRCSAATVYQRIRAGAPIPIRREGKRIFIPKEYLHPREAHPREAQKKVV